MSEEIIKGVRFEMSVSSCGIEYEGNVTEVGQTIYAATPEWTMKGPNKLSVLRDTVEALLWYEGQVWYKGRDE